MNFFYSDETAIRLPFYRPFSNVNVFILRHGFETKNFFSENVELGSKKL